jgi:hypothetical protein
MKKKRQPPERAPATRPISEKLFSWRKSLMNVNKKIVRLYKGKDGQKEERAAMSKAEAISFVDDLTREAFYLSGNRDVESRLQRHIVKVTRK